MRLVGGKERDAHSLTLAGYLYYKCTRWFVVLQELCISCRVTTCYYGARLRLHQKCNLFEAEGTTPGAAFAGSGVQGRQPKGYPAVPAEIRGSYGAALPRRTTSHVRIGNGRHHYHLVYWYYNNTRSS